MKRYAAIALSMVICLFFALSVTLATTVQVQQPVPTLVPPTLVPGIDAGVGDALLSESALAHVLAQGEVRVGLLYNAPPFGTLNLRGDVTGFEADLAKAMAEAWGVTFVPVQVTRQTALNVLANGDVEMLLASQVHRRDLDSRVEFSLTYYAGSESILVRQDDGAARLADMANRRVGYVMGTPGLEAISVWQQRSGFGVQLEPYLTLDQAYSALVNNEVDGVVDNRISLMRVVPQAGMGKILDEIVSPQPYGVVVRRQDVNWRNLINKTLQYLSAKGTLQQLYQTYLPGSPYSLGLVPVWGGVGDEAPKPDQFPVEVKFPTQYALPRVQQAGIVRVAGLAEPAADAPESVKRLYAVNRAMVEALVEKWNVQLEVVPDNGTSSIDLVASGQADLAVGVTLDWSATDQVDLTAPYLLHGERVMARVRDEYETFLDLRGRIVAVFASEAGAADRVNALAASANSGVRIFTVNREEDAASVVLSENNANVVFGDSLKLIAHVQAAPDDLRLTRRQPNPDAWYSRIYVGFAVPRNDLDFRLLVEYSMQELARSGEWQSILAPTLLPDDIPAFDIWPGTSDYMGYNLGQ